jgi:hypothetical protein
MLFPGLASRPFSAALALYRNNQNLLLSEHLSNFMMAFGWRFYFLGMALV